MPVYYCMPGLYGHLHGRLVMEGKGCHKSRLPLRILDIQTERSPQLIDRLYRLSYIQIKFSSITGLQVVAGGARY